MSALADELLRIILGPFFDVPDEHFADNGSVSPFSKVPQSAAELLRVCKRWMRFATPLLYSTVVIRTRAQAAALKMALTNNAEFGYYVRRLRLEGVYGEFITPDVIKTMPNVRYMCFPIGMLARDDTDGLLTAFELFELERVVLLSLSQHSDLSNATISQFIANLANFIPTWSNLKHVTLPKSNSMRNVIAIGTLGPALCLAPNLKTVTLGRNTILTHPRTLSAVACFELLKKPGLEHFIVQGLAAIPPRQIRGFFMRFPVDARSRVRAVNDVFCGTSFAERAVERPANQFWSPMFSLSEEERICIWTRIISFALEREDGTSIGFEQPWWEYRWVHVHHEKFDMMTGGACLRVSKEFNLATHRVIEAEVLFTAPVSYMANSMVTYERSLSRDPELPLFVRSLQTQWSLGPVPFPTSAEIQSIALDRMTALEQVVLQGCPERGLSVFWPTLRQAAGCNLVRLAIVYAGGNVDVREDALVAGLDNLRELYLHLRGRINFRAGPTPTDVSYLPQLEILRIADDGRNVYPTITRQELPCLRAVFLSQHSPEAVTFLVKHGAKLTQLGLADKMYTREVFDAVPNLTTLTISEPSVPRCLAALTHLNVSLINLDWALHGAGKHKILAEYMKRKVSDGEWPALRRITVMRHPREGLWPSDERTAKRSPWPQMATSLAAVGVAFTDRNGQEWRERLRYVDDEYGKEELPARVTRLRNALNGSAEISAPGEPADLVEEEGEEDTQAAVVVESSQRTRLRRKTATSPVRSEASVVASAPPPSSRQTSSRRTAVSKR